MAYQAFSLGADECHTIGSAWDSLASQRGLQADPYATYAWFAAWMRAAEPARRHRVAIAVVARDDQLVVSLALLRSRWSWSIAGAEASPRVRVAAAEEDPDPEAVDHLVSQIGRSGGKELVLGRLPTRDPATAMLIRSLRSQGYRVDCRERSCDNVSEADDSEFLHRLRKFQTSVRSLERRVSPYWDLRVEEFGGGAGPLVEGLRLFDQVQQRSWKGPSRSSTRELRREFLRRADRHRWVRLSILFIADRPVAGNLRLRVGDVTVGFSTAYEQQLAAYSPGSILHGRVLQDLRCEPKPRLVDFLPGDSPFKERLASQQSPLVTVEARRRSVVAGAALTPKRLYDRTRPQVSGFVRSKRRVMVARLTHRREPRPGFTLVEGNSGETRARVQVVQHTPALRRYLAAATGTASAEAVAAAWDVRDRWLLVDIDGPALVRVGVGHPPRVLELVPLGTSGSIDSITRALAGDLGGTVQVLRSLAPGRQPALPWRSQLAVGCEVTR